MTVSPAETARHLRARAAERLERITARSTLARALAERVAALLIREFGATEVWLWGSVARGRVHERSDIDLVVAGIAADRLDAARAAIETLDVDGGVLPVDLLALDALPEPWRARVVRDGVRLA
ncbi:MAG: hypothetical protein NVS3B10_05260 [Polyangiales bacterium]